MGRMQHVRQIGDFDSSPPPYLLTSLATVTWALEYKAGGSHQLISDPDHPEGETGERVNAENGHQPQTNRVFAMNAIVA